MHASPFLFDIDSDGQDDIGLPTYDGAVVFYSAEGRELRRKLQVPRLSVNRDWFVGLNPDHVDHSKPDVGDAPKGEWARLPPTPACFTTQQAPQPP